MRGPPPSAGSSTSAPDSRGRPITSSSKDRTERLVEICRQAGATTYLSGPAARSYIEPEIFQAAGVELRLLQLRRLPRVRAALPAVRSLRVDPRSALQRGTGRRQVHVELLPVTLSIVTTLYCSAPHLEEFYRRACAAAETVTTDYEIVLVNDGSPDDSLQIALELFDARSARARRRSRQELRPSQGDDDRAPSCSRRAASS